MNVNLYSYQTNNIADERPEWKRKDNNLKATRIHKNSISKTNIQIVKRGLKNSLLFYSIYGVVFETSSSLILFLFLLCSNHKLHCCLRICWNMTQVDNRPKF